MLTTITINLNGKIESIPSVNNTMVYGPSKVCEITPSGIIVSKDINKE